MEKIITVLLVEDEEMHAELIMRSVQENEEIEIIWSKSLSEARTILKVRQPDLLLTDMRLPDGQGIELCYDNKEIRKFPIVLMTIYGNEQLAVDAMKAGVMDYIVKSPAAFNEMPHLIRHCVREWNHIIEKKKAEEALRQKEEKYRMLVENIPDWVWEIDDNGRYIYSSRKVYDILGYSVEEVLGKKSSDFIDEEYRGRFSVLSEVSLNSQERNRVQEYQYIHKDGHKVFIETRQSPLYGPDETIRGFTGIHRDITERMFVEKKLYELSTRDLLTGLYNRNFFEEELKRLQTKGIKPLGMVMCDLDGLKLINDTLGHSTGDSYLITTGQMLTSAFSGESVIARIGGDEFAVLIEDLNEKEIAKACKKFSDFLPQKENNMKTIPLSVSLGYVFNEGKEKNVYEMFKEADNRLYREKLHRSQSIKSEFVQTLKVMLEARDFITEGHANRMEDLATKLAIEISLPEKDLADIRLLAQFHDIGKVGISDSILFKPSKLTSEEYEIMKRHSEIGHRIAQVSVDLIPISEAILKHHERWDGNGYPFGLKGEDIPIHDRILAIVDAYDAITNDRPYSKARTKEEAIAELKRCSGTQFDPFILEKFINMIASTET